MSKKIEKILIANRGEIAARIIKTCKRLGIKSVCVYSEVDSNAYYLKQADQSFSLGGSSSTESYLNSSKIIELALYCGADAIHPGYGFLSENSAFAKLVTESKLTFIGPNPDVIQLMGDKIKSKQFALQAGVPCVPGESKSIESAAEVKKVAQKIGFPILLKASSGGGGKGMRIVYHEGDLERDLVTTQNEALNSFGDKRVFVEKFVENPRHIEIQIAADKHGNVIHLGERECSIQRRNQKVIEEAPSPVLAEEIRKKMGSSAVKLSKSAGYDSIGTVEFIVDQQFNFYFIEMNTRVQVEHPVTEMVTGLDLIELQIKSAQEEHLQLKQEDIKIKGHSIEARLYAEDPKKNFMPSPGAVQLFSWPEDSDVRVENSIVSGSSVSVFYDPMIAKIIVHDESRNLAIEKLLQILNETLLIGVQTNLNLLISILKEKNFRAGLTVTNYVQTNFPDHDFIETPEKSNEVIFEAAISYFYIKESDLFNYQDEGCLFLSNENQDVKSLDWFRKEEGKILFKLNQEDFEIKTFYSHSSNSMNLLINDHPYLFQFSYEQGFLFTARHSNQKLERRVYSEKEFFVSRWVHLKENASAKKSVVSPMPGKIVEIFVAEQMKVEPGDKLVSMEAMKMENLIYADFAGKIEKINCEKNGSVKAGEVLIKLE